jgi:hypothetical protein
MSNVVEIGVWLLFAVAFWLAASAVAIFSFTSPSRGEVFLAENASAFHGLCYVSSEDVRALPVMSESEDKKEND